MIHKKRENKMNTKKILKVIVKNRNKQATPLDFLPRQKLELLRCIIEK